MKKYLISILTVLIISTLLAGCFLQNPANQIDGIPGVGDLNDLSEERTGTLPNDIISDVPRSSGGSFNFETMLPVTLVVDAEFFSSSFEQLAAEQQKVLVMLKDSSGNPVFGGMTDADGVLKAELKLPGAPESMTLLLYADGFKSREVVIPDMVRYEKIDRTMGLEAVGNQSRAISGLLDNDGDGIPDVYDAYPNDSDSAFAYLMPADGYLTVAYEDLFGRAGAGDADYNDFIAHYNIEESSNAEGITKIQVNATAAVKLAGYNHKFGIRINSFVPPANLHIDYIDENGNSASYSTMIDSYPNPGETSLEIVLFENSGKAVGQTAGFTLDFVVVGETEEESINNPQDPAVLSRPPYNPFLYVLNTGHDVHLINEEPLNSSINPDDTFRDSAGFPWALLVPPGTNGWAHPAEGQRIEEPYPRFTRWRESGGELSPDWYLHDTPWVAEPVVYTAGYYNNGTNDVAAYWKDDKINLLSNTSNNARANDVFAYNGDVYTVGYEGPSGGEKAALWKNGVKIEEFTAGDETRGEARAVWVDASGVYVAGYFGYGSQESVWYWDGSGLHYLVENKLYGDATGIAVHGGAVYVAGYYTTANYPFVASYWVDGVEIHPGGVFASLSRGFGLDVSAAGDVFIPGLFYYNSNYSSGYWSSVSDFTPLYTSAYSYAYGIDEVNGEVYISGYYGSGTGTAVFWLDDGQNISQTILGIGRALDIVVADAVYSSGYLYDGQKKIGGYWKGTDFNVLYDSGLSGLGSEVNSIFIAD